MPTDSRKNLKRLSEDGWLKVGQTGSHGHLKHPDKPGKVTVHPKKDLPKGLIVAIEKQPGVRIR